MSFRKLVNTKERQGWVQVGSTPVELKAFVRHAGEAVECSLGDWSLVAGERVSLQIDIWKVLPYSNTHL